MIKKLFRQMLLTQIVSSMTVTLCMLVDSIMIGRFLGEDSMTAYGLASPLLLVFAAFGSLISSGVQVLCSKTVGRGDQEATDACYSVSVSLAAGISAVGLVLVFVLLRPLTTLLGAGHPGTDNPVFGLTKDYIVGFIIGAPAFLCAQIMVPYMQLAGCRTRLVAAVIAMTVTDIALDLLNVFVLRWGTLGMGLASTVSYYVAFGIGAGYFLRKDCMFHFRRRLIKASVGRELSACGVPTVVNQISMVFLVFLLNRMLLEVEGNRAVAAYSVISTVGNLCYCFGSGIGAVAMMLAAIFYTDRDRDSILELLPIMTRSAIVLDVVVTLVGLLLAEPLVTLFLGSGVSAKLLAVSGLRLFVLSMVPSSINSSFKNYYQGVNRLRLTELISVLQNFVFPVFFAFVLSRFWGVTGIWLGFLCGETAALIAFSCLVWRRHGSVSISAEAYSMLEPDFGAAADRCLCRKLHSLEEAMAFAEEVPAFCLKHGLDKRLSNLIGLCVEEMTVNVVRHGFSFDRLSHDVEVRLVLDEDRRIIRIRDNCINFDPVKYMELHKSSDPTAHIGLRLVLSMVKDSSYVNSLGLNNLTLVL